MSMRITTRWELDKLRELVRHLLWGKTCFFCHKPLLTNEMMVGHKPGSGRGRPLFLKIAEHHIDGNHENDAHENLALAHDRCHRAFHLAETRAAMRAAKAAAAAETSNATDDHARHAA